MFKYKKATDLSVPWLFEILAKYETYAGRSADAAVSTKNTELACS
mgnify:CR=1 FL=1